MSIFAIGDLHLPGHAQKPMDVFGSHWDRHFETISDHWRRMVGPTDVVLIPGDISWAMQLDQALDDLRAIAALPGRKLLLRGNHDYWWSSLSKLRAALPEGMFALQNDALALEGHIFCGTRGWMFDCTQPHDEKVMARECGRLRASLDAAGEGEKIVFLHYPPVYPGANAAQILDILHEYGVRRCYYGHIHSNGCRFAFQGEWQGVQLTMVSADYLAFMPKKIG